MSNKLFVGRLSWDTTDASLRQAFEPHGDIQEAVVINDRDTGRSRGFGFVTFDEAASAEEARQALDGTEIDGRTVVVNEAHDRR